MKLPIMLLALLFLTFRSIGQTTETDLYITANGNLYLPVGNPEKGMYPILWYDKETDPKILVGGFGLGVLAAKPWGSKTALRGQANFSKHTYWDEPILARTATNYPAGLLVYGTSDYSLGITGTAHYFLSEKLSVGAGLGVQALLVSLSRSPVTNDHQKEVYRNRHYKPLMPVIPVELSYRSEKKIFNIRYEQGLLNRLKGDLSEYQKDHFGLITFEVGFKIRG